MKYSLKIGSIWGIPIHLHITFILLVGAVFVLSFPQLYLFILVLFLFVFVVLHELAHSAVARKYSIKVRKIVLYPIGGVSEIEEIAANPAIEWRVAIAGPMTSFAIGASLLLLDALITVETPQTVIAPQIATAGRLILDLGVLNLVLGAFNLIPAFPMDGGRVFRALLAERIKYSDATKYSVYIGKVLGIAIAIVGILYNFWLTIIGVFIYIGASEESEQTIVSTTLAHVRVRDVMHKEAESAKPETTLDQALELMLKKKYHDILVERDSAFQGIVTWRDIMKVEAEKRSEVRIGQLPLTKVSIFQDESVLEADKIMDKEQIDLLPVVKKDNPSLIVGVLTKEAVAEAYKKSRE